MTNLDLFISGAHTPPSEVSFQGGEPTRPLLSVLHPVPEPVEDRNPLRGRLAARSGPRGALQVPL